MDFVDCKSVISDLNKMIQVENAEVKPEVLNKMDA